MILDPTPTHDYEGEEEEAPLSPRSLSQHSLPLPSLASHDPVLRAKELLENQTNTPVWKRILMMLVGLILEITVPMGIYFILRTFMNPMIALLLSGIPALLSFIVQLAWKRKVSAIAMIMFLGLVGTSALALATDDPRLLLVEKSLMMGIMGLLHTVTSVSIPLYSFHRKGLSIRASRNGHIKPFAFYTVAQLAPLGDMNTLYTNGVVMNKYQWLYENIPQFRRHLVILNAVSGVTLCIEFVAKIFLIYSSLSVDKVILYSNLLFFIVLSLSFAFSGVYIYFAKTNFYRDVDAWIQKHHPFDQQLTDPTCISIIN